MTDANIKRSLITTVSLMSLISCAPLHDKVTHVSDRPARAASNQPTNMDEGYYQGAVRAIIAGDYASALDYLQAARQTQANDVRVLNAFGVVYDKLGRFDLSARYYAQALAVNPRSPIVTKNLAYSGVLQKLASVPPGQPETAEAATAPAALEASSSIRSPALVRDMGAPAQVAEVKVADANAPAIAASDPVSAIQAASIVPPPSINRSMGNPAHVAQIKVADTTVPATTASDVPSANKAASDVPHPSIDRNMGPPAQVAQTKVADSTAPAIAAAERHTLIQSKFNVLSPSIIPALGAPGPVIQTKMLHAVVPAKMPSQSPAETRTTPRSRSADFPRTVTLQEQPVQAGKAHVVAQIPTPEVAPSQRVRGLTGHPLAVVNATGRREMAEPVRRQLVQLGWSAPHWAATEIPKEQYTTIRYAEPDAIVAHALARTLPFPVHFATCADHCKGIVLTMGTNYLGWKPFFARLLRWTL